MKQHYLFLLVIITLSLTNLRAQVPAFPVQSSLNENLRTQAVFDSSKDTVKLHTQNASHFSLEFPAQIDAATGRGLDVFYKNKLGRGFRTSLSKTEFNLTTDLNAPQNLSLSVDNAQKQTYRYVVDGDDLHIYLDGYYLTSQKIEQLSGSESANPVTYGPDNLLGAWAGTPGNNSGKPTDYGWSNNQITSIFNTANAGSGVRYMDLSSGHVLDSDGSNFNGRLMYIRWDGNDYSTSTYSYPIDLKAGASYEFSWLYELVANTSPGAKLQVAISSDQAGTNRLFSESYTTAANFRLREGKLAFTAPASGKHYLTLTGDWGLYGIGQLQLKSSDLINKWDGLAIDQAGSPDHYGWASTDAGVNWATANSTAGVRYLDVTSGHLLEEDGGNFEGRILALNWENVSGTRKFSFPIELQADQTYEFSALAEGLNGTTSDLTWSIAGNPDGSSVLKTTSFPVSDRLKTQTLTVKPSSNGTFFLIVEAASGSFGLANLSVLKKETEELIIGRNHNDGTLNATLDYISFEADTFAPTPVSAPSTVEQTITSQNLSTMSYAKTNLNLTGNTRLHLSNPVNPLINAQLNISDDAVVYFDKLRPSEVIGSVLQFIRVDGASAVEGTNVSVSASGAGSRLTTYASDYSPLTVYTEENYGGHSQTFVTVTPYNNLGDLDNKIKSLKLKKGFMATLASNANGTGYSRVFIAEDEDLEIPVLQPYLYGTVSFIRTMKWHEVSKKGLAGGGDAEQAALDITWYYNWNTGLNSSPNIEYVPIRQTRWWPDLGPANTKEGYTHLLGYNEPDRPDQANLDVQGAIDGWPGLLQSGLRLGSPATSDPFNPWLGDFMQQAEARNYRVDYMAIHCYWYKSPSQWASDLQNIYNRYKRPLWITEWNIGANWTGNNFPDGPQVLTDANAQKQKNDLIAILDLLDNTDYVERYSIYNWVEDARAMFVTIDDAFRSRNPNHANYEWLKTAPVVASWEGDSGTIKVVLTPAGQYYAANASEKAFKMAYEYTTTWKPLAPVLEYEVADDYKSIDLKWTGNNFDLISKYVVERKLEGESNFSAFFETEDFTVLTKEDGIQEKADYRIRAIGKDGTASPWSNVVQFVKEELPQAPTGFTGEALSPFRIALNWEAPANASSYVLQRAAIANGTYTDIASNFSELTFIDENLTASTTYYYRVAALNTAGTGTFTETLAVTTPAVSIPDAVNGVRIGAADAQVSLFWNARYDESYYIKRADAADGNFETLATVTGTPYVDQNLTNDTSYFYKIVPFTAAGEQENNEIFEAKPQDGRHLYFNFEGEGDKILDVWNMKDALAMTTFTRETGAKQNAIHLTGGGYMQLPEGVVSALTDFTVSTWIKLDQLSNWNRVFDFGTGTDNWMALEAANGSGKLQYEIEHGGTRNRVSTDLTLSLNEWMHVAIVQAGNTATLYVNGNAAGSAEVTLKPADLGNTTANYLGKSQYPDPLSQISYDEFKIFNYGLPKEEIEKLADTERLGTEKNSSSDKGIQLFSANSTLYCNYSGDASASYRLYTITGQLLGNGNLANGVTNTLGQFSSGIYIVQVATNTKTESIKVIVD